MPFRNIYILILLLICLSACNRIKPYTPTKEQAQYYSLLFTPVKPIDTDNIHVDLQLRAKTTGDTLLFSGIIVNKSADTLKINPGELQIENSKGIRSDLSGMDTRKLVVLPHSTDTVRFNFAPLNNPDLYSAIAYNGDMDSVYSIPLNFITRNNTAVLPNQKLRFVLSDKDYSAYKKIYGRERKLSVYKLDNIDVKAKLDQLVAIHHKDININGVTLSLNYYREDSSLFLQARIINHNPSVIIITPLKLDILVKRNTISPEKLHINGSAISNKNTFYGLRGGDRLEFKLDYGKVIANNLTFTGNGIFYLQGRKNVLPALNFTSTH